MMTATNWAEISKKPETRLKTVKIIERMMVHFFPLNIPFVMKIPRMKNKIAGMRNIAPIAPMNPAIPTPSPSAIPERKAPPPTIMTVSRMMNRPMKIRPMMLRTPSVVPCHGRLAPLVVCGVCPRGAGGFVVSM